MSRKKLKYNKIQKLKQKKTKFLKKKKITKIKEIHKLLQQKNNKQIDVIKMIYSKITNKAFKNAIKPFLRK